MKKMTSVAVLVAACSVSVSQAVVVGFDDLPNGSSVTTQYPGVTFSTLSGQFNMAYGFVGATSASNILCTADVGGSVNCANPTYLDFTNPVNSLTFWAIEPNNSGPVAQFNIFTVGNAPVSVILNGLAGSGNVLVDLSAYSNVTRLEIVPAPGFSQLDEGGGGIGWDDFSFTPVPAPSGLALVGIAGLMTSRRRR